MVNTYNNMPCDVDISASIEIKLQFPGTVCTSIAQQLMSICNITVYEGNINVAHNVTKLLVLWDNNIPQEHISICAKKKSK